MPVSRALVESRDTLRAERDSRPTMEELLDVQRRLETQCEMSLKDRVQIKQMQALAGEIRVAFGDRWV